MAEREAAKEKKKEEKLAEREAAKEEKRLAREAAKEEKKLLREVKRKQKDLPNVIQIQVEENLKENVDRFHREHERAPTLDELNTIYKEVYAE